MITQYRLKFEAGAEKISVEWAYRLYAALLKQCPRDFGVEAHCNQITPISQFLDCKGMQPVWRVSLLGEDCEDALGPTLEKAESFCLSGTTGPLWVSNREKRQIRDVEQLFQEGEKRKGRHCLRFCTPTSFKSQGRYQTMPSQRLIVQSLIRRWNGCIRECPIEDPEGQGVEALAAGLVISDFHIHSCAYRLKGSSVPGFAGSMTIDNRLDGFHRQLADALLVFAGYAGIGIKTTLGMGGIKEEKF